MDKKVSQTPRDTNWENDGIGVLDGQIHIQCATFSYAFTPQGLRDALERASKYSQIEFDHQTLRQRLDDWHNQSSAVKEVIQTIEKLGSIPDGLRGDTGAGLVMTGQSQAYRDAAVILRQKFGL